MALGSHIEILTSKFNNEFENNEQELKTKKSTRIE